MKRRHMSGAGIWPLLAAAALMLACSGRSNDVPVRDATDSGAAVDVIGRPEGADSLPARMRDPADPTDRDSLTAYKRPEQRPIRKPDTLTRRP